MSNLGASTSLDLIGSRFLPRVCIARNAEAERCNIYGLSVRLSVTFWCFVQTNEDTIMRSSASGRTIILVSGELKFIRTKTGKKPLERDASGGTDGQTDRQPVVITALCIASNADAL